MRISIGLKIFSIALTLSVLMAAAAFYSVWKVHEIARESDVVARSYLTLVERVADVDKFVLEQEILMERVRLLALDVPRDDKALTDAQRAFEAQGVKAASVLERTAKLLDYAVRTDPSREAALEAVAIRSLLDRVGREQLEFSNHASKLIHFTLTGRDDARDAFTEMIAEEERDFDNSVKLLREKVAAFAHDAATQARNDAQALQHFSLMLTGLAVLLGLLIAAGITFGVVRPVRRLLAGMQEVRGGDLDVRVTVTSRDEIGQLSSGFNEMTDGLKAKEQIKSVFGHYLDPRIVDQLISRPDLTEPGGERRTMTIFFSDIAGFTAISEQFTAPALVNLINAYLTEMSEPIQSENGVVDKFIGDAIMAFWGPPFVAAEEQGVRACRAALASLERLEAFQPRIPEITGLRANAPRLDIRIGLAAGPVLVGNVGSATQKNYTVMGDTVNVASRLEGACKQYGLRILMSESCKVNAGAAIATREIDALAVKGKDEPIRVFQPLIADAEPSAEMARLRDTYEAALADYRGRRWDDAETGFKAALEIDPDDRPSAVMLERIAHLREADLPEEWDGVWRMQTK